MCGRSYEKLPEEARGRDTGPPCWPGAGAAEEGSGERGMTRCAVYGSGMAAAGVVWSRAPRWQAVALFGGERTDSNANSLGTRELRKFQSLSRCP